MLSKLLRSRTILVGQKTFMRSGFSHPDPPPMTSYKFKRPYSLYDANMWYHDEVQPEFILTYQDPWIHRNSTFFILKQITGVGIFLVAIFAFNMVLLLLFSPKLHPEEVNQNPNRPFHADYVQDQKSLHEDPKYKTDMIGIPLVKSQGLDPTPGPKKFYESSLSFRREMDLYNKDLKNYVDNLRKRVIAEKFGEKKEAAKSQH